MLSRLAHLFGVQQDETEDPTTAQENAASIDAIPTDVPAGDPLPQDLRAALRELAAAGYDLYVYSSAAGWNVWSGELLDERTGYHGARLPVAAWRSWADHFRQQDGGAA